MTDYIDYIERAKELKDKRERLGISRDALASKLGISYWILNNLETKGYIADRDLELKLINLYNIIEEVTLKLNAEIDILNIKEE